MATNATIYILPTTITDLTATDYNGTVATLSDFTLSSYGYALDIGTGEKLACGNITFVSTGYKTQTVDCYTDTTHTITLEKDSITVTRDSTQDTQDIYYTKSSSPAVGDIIYNSNKEDSGHTISAVGSGTIEWTDTRTISFTITGKTSYTHSLKINDSSFSYSTTGDTGSIQINPGESVTITETGISQAIITDSSNTDYIKNQYITDLTQTFIMPDEDLTFELYISNEPA